MAIFYAVASETKLLLLTQALPGEKKQSEQPMLLLTNQSQQTMSYFSQISLKEKGFKMLASEILDLGDKVYFDRVETWYKLLCQILEKHHCVPSPLPEIHTYKGRGFVEFTGRENGQVYFTWYKMPSGRYEIVCYRS
jgi:hypothetical protein